jgi:hypothetical protein
MSKPELSLAHYLSRDVEEEEGEKCHPKLSYIDKSNFSSLRCLSANQFFNVIPSVNLRFFLSSSERNRNFLNNDLSVADSSCYGSQKGYRKLELYSIL